MIALGEVRDFFNVGKNISDTQMALTADLIAERFPDLRVEDLKKCFHRAMLREKLFDRLDGNIILRWLSEYDAERTDIAATLSEQLDAERCANASKPAPDAITFSQYVENLQRAADSGDKDAAHTLGIIQNLKKSTPAGVNKDTAFFKWFNEQWLPYQNRKTPSCTQ